MDDDIGSDIQLGTGRLRSADDPPLTSADGLLNSMLAESGSHIKTASPDLEAHVESPVLSSKFDTMFSVTNSHLEAPLSGAENHIEPPLSGGDNQMNAPLTGAYGHLETSLNQRWDLPFAILIAYRCKICKVGFTTEDELAQHMRKHPDFKCALCHEVFETLDDKADHSKNYGHASPHKCDLCSRSFKVKCTLTQHMRVHDQLVEFKCENCRRSFPEELFKKHKRENPARECAPFKCSLCQSCFIEKKSLDRHFASHVKRVVKCLFCDESFENNVLLSKHLLKHDLEKRAGVKRQAGSRKSDEKGSKLTSNSVEYVCNVCKSHFTSAQALRFHRDLVHRTFALPGQSKLDNKPNHRCAKCLGNFDTKMEMKLHLIEQPDCVLYVCNMCNNVFDSLEKKTEHLQAADHSKYQCLFCEKSFKVKCTLEQHTRVHARGGPEVKCHRCHETFSEDGLRRHLVACGQHSCAELKCRYCGRFFTDVASLRRHLEEEGEGHAENTPRKCFFCSELFSDAKALVEHMWSHDMHEHVRREKTLVCFLCDKRYRTRAQLDIHFRSHSGEKPFYCHHCEKAYATKSGFYTHNMKYHKGGEKRSKQVQSKQPRKSRSKNSKAARSVKRTRAESSPNSCLANSTYLSSNQLPDSVRIKKEGHATDPEKEENGGESCEEDSERCVDVNTVTAEAYPVVKIEPIDDWDCREKPPVGSANADQIPDVSVLGTVKMEVKQEGS